MTKRRLNDCELYVFVHAQRDSIASNIADLKIIRNVNKTIVKKPNLGCYFRSNPTPMPKQKLPTNAKPTSQSFSFPTKPQIDVTNCRRAGRNSDREKNTSEGKCRGSKDELAQNDEDESNLWRCGKESARVSVLSLSLARLTLATSWDNILSHSASHSILLHSGPDTLELVAGQDRSSIARSTSRHRRKRSAASARSEAKVSGVRNRPVRRAMIEFGRKEDRV